MKYRDC